MYFSCWIFHVAWCVHALVPYTESKVTRNEELSSFRKIPSWNRELRTVGESNRMFRSSSKGIKNFRRNINKNSASDVVDSGQDEKGQFKPRNPRNKTSRVANDNSKRQYIYGVPSAFSSFQPRQNFAMYPRSGIRRGACLHHICYHGGVCVRTLHGFYCDCPEEYIGAHCEFKRECLQNPCKNGATCTELGQGDFTCTCPLGSKGKTCELKDSCVPNPCDNDGLCTEIEDGYHCTCKLGFKGDRCHLKALCYPSPCKNGGTCIDRDNNEYQCSCVLGFKGNLCEITSECKKDPCVNGGTCVELAVGYRCACLKGFVGKNCEVTLCSPNPCANDGMCKVNGDHYSCNCAKHYVGRHCEALNPCLNTPCLNGGECVVTRSSMGDISDGFSCKCLRGYYGNMCQMR